MHTSSQRRDDGPRSLGDVLSKLTALRGYGRVRGDRTLAQAWAAAAGAEIASKTRVIGLRNGVLQIGVTSAALLGELTSFHRQQLLESLRSSAPGLSIKDLKFRKRAPSETAVPRRAPSPGRDAQGRRSSGPSEME